MLYFTIKQIERLKYFKKWLSYLFRKAISICKSPTKPPRNAPVLNKLKESNLESLRWNRTRPYAYSFENLKFIHIGKCGGSAIIQHFLNAGINLTEYHLQRPHWSPRDWYFLWVRNPIKRFVSAFNHSKSILEFDITNCDPQSLSVENCPDPFKIMNRMKHGVAFDHSYDELIRGFRSANELAESLTSTSSKLQYEALKTMGYHQEHLYKGIGWYLINGLFVEECYGQILFAGRLEYMKEDFQRLTDKLGLHDLLGDSNLPHIRSNNMPLSKDLSELAIQNIRNFYLKSDYRALNSLRKWGFIDEATVEEYHEF